MIERKCLSCKTWNNEEDYCKNCGEALSPKALDVKREKRLADEEAAKVPSKVDVYLEKAKHSKYFLVRIVYYIVYSIFMIIGGLGAIMAWLTALANG